MAIKNDLSDLPTAARTGEDGRAPDAEPRFVHLLAEQWAADSAERDRDYQRRTRFHLSDAGGCARRIAYAALDLPASDPMDLTGIHNTRLGTLLHVAWQAVLIGRSDLGAVEIEPRHVILDGEGSGYSDAVIRGDRTVAVEFKTIGGFGFKMAIGERGNPEGPKFEHIIQGALNAKAADADELVIAYLSKEAISVNIAARKRISELGRFCAEWTYSRDEFLPLAEAEETRVAGILRLLDEGTLPARKVPTPEVPPGALIVDAKSGRWEVATYDDGDRLAERQVIDTGTWWGCGYCRYQTLCVPTPAERTPVDVVIRGVA